MNKVAFFYNLGYQMAKMADDEETFGEIYKRQLPYWMGLSSATGLLASLLRRPTSLSHVLGATLIGGPIGGALQTIPAALITKATRPKKKKWFSSD